MAENGFGPMAGHVGRIPNFGKTQVNPMGHNEPPACIQNAMMTKDKKPFTYTPGGLDLSQIRTPSMARRLARQRSQEEHEQAYAQQNYAPQTNGGGGGYQSQGVPNPPPPPPPGVPAPPPPPPLVIEIPKSKSPKPVPLGERPEIVIPENPIGMLRKTNSPYHWEAEKADALRMGPVPKFVEKVPSPLTVQMPPSSFSNQAPQYTPPSQNTNYSYNNQGRQPESPLHKPEALYAHQKSNSPSVKTPTIELLQRQDSQFNKSPQPFGGQSPISNGSPYSPSPNNNWRQPERRESPAQNASNSPQSPHVNRSPFTPNQQYSPNFQNQSPPVNSSPVYHTLPRVGQKNQEVNNVQNNQYQQSNADSDPTPWRTNTLNRHPREPERQNNVYNNNNQNENQQAYSPPWKTNEANNNESAYTPPWLQARNQNTNQQQYTPPWVTSQDSNNNGPQESYNAPWRSSDNNNNRAAQSPPKPAQPQEQPRYQSSMSIPVTPRRQNPPADYNNTPPQKEVVYVNQEPVYFCPESPKSIPPWVKSQKEKTKTPPPEWVQRPLDSRKSATRDLVTPPRETTNQEPEWVKKSNEMQRGIRDVISPPKYQQTAQPSWSTRPSENRKSVPKEAPGSPGNRVIPIQMEVSSTDTRDQGRQGQAPHLRITIGMNPNGPNAQAQSASYSQPTQRIMRVLSPQLVRMDEGQSQHELPTLSRHLTSNQDNQPKTRIIPIQIEGASNGANKRVFYHKFTQEAPPRQSKAFRVLQVITGTQDSDRIQNMETQHGFTDL
ncbi:extensin-like isoform X1 [Leguminivora glycinivorella]|uniref:extensin-like isoform X1 n=1 Tax=Leguminivora glycinivorella TaxID=1035111 RepID=UPI00200E2D3D|nr:extensin-like isoform X1 [Leguminivora glycinivorella]